MEVNFHDLKNDFFFFRFKHDNGKISKAILKMMKSDLPGPYPTYKHLPRDAKTRWFRAFAVLNLSL